MFQILDTFFDYRPLAEKKYQQVLLVNKKIYFKEYIDDRRTIDMKHINIYIIYRN